MKGRKSNFPSKEKWYLVVDEEGQQAVLVRTSGDADAAKEKYFKMCELGGEDLKEAMEQKEGMEVTPLNRLLDTPMSYIEIWRG